MELFPFPILVKENLSDSSVNPLIGQELSICKGEKQFFFFFFFFLFNFFLKKVCFAVQFS